MLSAAPFINSKNRTIIHFIKEIKKGLKNTDIRFINEIKGQFFSNPLISISLSICLFSMAGNEIMLAVIV